MARTEIPTFSDEQIQAEEYKRVRRQVRTAPQNNESRTPKYSELIHAAEIENAANGIFEYSGDPVLGPQFVEQYQILRRAAGRRADEYKRKLEDYIKRKSDDQYGPEGARGVLLLLRDAIQQSANLTRPEKEVCPLWQRGLSQSEIAERLKRTQPAISKAMKSMKIKLYLAEQDLIGPHDRVQRQLTHFADTHGLTGWGRDYIKEHGENPPFCRNCESLYRREQELKVH
ncbi:MAG: hypothetical protein GXY47_00725 [Acidobacteria bacterium]|nr:hypothetical protein [Acidobacteriota bacterium]